MKLATIVGPGSLLNEKRLTVESYTRRILKQLAPRGLPNDK